ncbi:MAG: DUF4920 domain-containing protein [Melioribacteraceae bacterium]|nr:DUF4920 domain-containing protein [Melioribacteraceae bacterium]
MRKYILTIAIFILCSVLLTASEGKKYGAEITIDAKTKISEILENPESFVGKKVLVEGLVVDVCSKRGCWIEVAGDQKFQSIRIKVNDGEIVFPMETKGETALVEGEVYSFDVELEPECSGHTGESCSAEETKETAEASCCSKEKKVKKVYQIKGSGAVI